MKKIQQRPSAKPKASPDFNTFPRDNGGSTYFFTDFHWDMMKRYLKTNDESVYNEYVYPVLYRIADIMWCLLVGPSSDNTRVIDTVTHMTLNLYKLDRRYCRRAVYTYLSNMVRIYINNNRRRFADASRKTVSLDTEVGEGRFADFIPDTDREKHISDDLDVYKRIVDFWSSNGRIHKVFGPFTLPNGKPNRLRWAFRDVLAALKGETREGKPRKAQMHRKRFHKIILDRMEKETKENYKGDQ
jgi:hypothetical protein